MARRELTTFKEVLDVLGGVPGVADITKRSTQNVCNWRRRKYFPAVLYPKIEKRLNRLRPRCTAALALFRFELDDEDEADQKHARAA